LAGTRPRRQTMDDDKEETPFLDTVEGEVSFFRSIMRARPVGLHRHFHALAIRNAIYKDTGQSVSFDDIWQKLETLYNLDALEALESEGYDSPSSNNSVYSIRSPSPSENLSAHPFFHEEFALPLPDEVFENLLASRRLRATASAASTPSHTTSPASAEKTSIATLGGGGSAIAGSNIPSGSKGRARDRGKMAGLVAGDSDSSALTQESGDESIPAPTPRDSVNTGTEAGTDEGEDEDVEMAEPSPEPAPASKSTKGQKAASKKGGGASGRTRSATVSSSRPKKRKR